MVGEARIRGGKDLLEAMISPHYEVPVSIQNIGSSLIPTHTYTVQRQHL